MDPDKYCYFDFMEDVCKAIFSDPNTQVGLSVVIYCDIPDLNEKMLVGGDIDMLRMFTLNVNKRNINLYVEVQKISTQSAEVRSVGIPSPCNNEGGIGGNEDQSENVKKCENAEEGEDCENSDDVFGFDAED